MNQRDRSRLRTLMIICLCAASGGALYSIAVAANTSTADQYDYLFGIARGIWTGIAIALPIASWEIFYVNGPPGTWLRRLPFSAHLGIRTLFYVTVIVLCLWSAVAMFGDADEVIGMNATTIAQLSFAFVAALIANFSMSLNRLLGQSVFLNFLTGRYHQPKVEHHVLMFVDLTNSTALAEEIGDLDFHRYLNELYRVLAGPVIENRGLIHKYVGDEMIVSWRDTPANRQAALLCGLDIRDVLTRQAQTFADRFGHPPGVRCGIHAGPVVAGEMGDFRQEIVYLGDAMNVTARLVEECRTLSRPLLVSNAALDAVAAEEFATVEDMGEIAIRGRQKSLSVSALSRRPNA